MRVVLIEPGPANTPWNDVAASTLTETDQAAADDDPYAGYKASVSGSFVMATDGPLARLASDADDVAAVIVTAVTAARPRARYLINAVARTLVVSRAVLPTTAWDFVVRRMYSMPTRPADRPVDRAGLTGRPDRPGPSADHGVRRAAKILARTLGESVEPFVPVRRSGIRRQGHCS